MSERPTFIPLAEIHPRKQAVLPTVPTEDGYSHATISRVLDLSNNFFASSEGRKHVSGESQKIAESMQSVDGFVGSFATGFPFFLPEQGGFRPVPEISRFLRATNDIVATDEQNNPHGWNCPDCQIRNNLPDLKTLCKPCEIVDLKPRDIFKAVPDVDVFVVAEDPSLQTMRQIEKTLRETGRSQSDTDITGTIENAIAVFEALAKDEEPSQTLPVDIHLLSREDFQSGMKSMLGGDLGYELDMQSLHMTWEPDKIPFGYDFILQLTPLEFRDKTLLDEIHATRRELKETFGEQTLIETVAAVPRGARLLGDEHTRGQLRQRLAKW